MFLQPFPRWLATAIFGVATVATISPPAVDAAGLLIADGGLGGALELKQQTVRVTINNSIAVTQIDQVFLNTENRIVEALYTFPVPREASVSNFSMWIGGKEMIGEVLEKKRAREIYESYKVTKRDPGLLEQVDFKQFEMRIFPIPAGAEQRVRIEYYQELSVDHDWATYVYPLATDTKGREVNSRVDGRFSMTVDINSEVPIMELKSESHGDDFVVVNHQADYAQAAMELNEGDLSRDIVMSVQMKRPRTGLDLVTSRPQGEDGYFMMTLTPGDDLSSTAEPMDYVFLLDVSGSMAHGDKLELSRNSVLAFIESLGPEDRFDCLAFNLAPTPLFKQMTTANSDNITQTSTFLSSQRARGGTVLQPAISAAYAYRDDDRPLNVVLLSDGMTEVGEQSELLRLIGSRPEGVRVFCVGIGNEVNRPLLEQMARDAGGIAAFVSTEDSFARQAQLMRQKLVRPAIENVTAQFAGAGVSEVEPTELGNLFYGTPLRMYGRYSAPGSVEVTLRGKIQGAAWEQTVQMELPSTDEGNSEIERMWAQKRMQRLFAMERSGKGSQQEEIVRLCEGYSIVSPYASMLVLENDAEYKRWKIEQRNAVRIQRDRKSRQVLQEKLAVLRDKSSSDFEVNRGQELTSTRSNSPVTGNQPSQQRADGLQAPSNSPSADRGVDLEVGPSFQSGGSGGGAGAIEPFTALLAMAATGAAAWNARRRRNQGRNSTKIA